MDHPPPILYLHGFASSPGSFKARRFAETFQRRGLAFEVPDLNEGDFTGITISRQLALVERVAAGLGHGPLLLMGSSMGAYLAALFASRSPRVAALALMAPAFGFIQRWTARLTPAELARWQSTGTLEVMHFAEDRMVPLAWEMVPDARQHPPAPRFAAPAIVFHGERDDAVPVQTSVQYARENPNVTLVRLDSDHGLGDVTDLVVQRSLEFLAPWLGPDLHHPGQEAP